MFTGLSAFPLTPMNETEIDESAFSGIVSRLADAGVESIGALGSTGSYAYLTREERKRVAQLAVAAAGTTPVMIGIGSLRTAHVRSLAEDAQDAGAAAVLLAPMSYQQLTAEEVFGLYEAVTRELSVPLCVYDNPGTTHFTFTDELHGRIAELPKIGSIKIPGVPVDPAEAAGRVKSLRSHIPSTVTIGVSGDPFAAAGLDAGCDVWYSVLAGVLPKPCLALARASRNDDQNTATALSNRLEPIWELFRTHGSLRVVSAIAEHLGLVESPNLPLPVRGLAEAARSRVANALEQVHDLL
ncbi:dihydrodipicolinate synthase family protein [Rhodococcus wratislaviensis]|uniref:dihydrodipicolinate synthase family protein n=1 Tax=Rhodococcus wratislaviensis TaxID=44752 RepID=UPI003657D03C